MIINKGRREMELTEREAITKTQEMWKELAETGETKGEYFTRKGIGDDDQPCCGCYLCEFSEVCDDCPYFKHYQRNCDGSRGHRTVYDKCVFAKTPEKRKFWAAKFLVMLNRL